MADMTKEVAIERLNRCREVLEFSSHMDNQNREAFEMAIKALEQEPCEDAVNREAVLNLKQVFHDNAGYETEYVDVEDIKTLPPVNSKPKTGRWEYGYAFADGNYCKCSECKEIIKCIYPMHYCPNCGADMRGE